MLTQRPLSTRWIRTVATILAIALVAAACGGDESSLVADATSGTAETEGGSEFCNALGEGLVPTVENLTAETITDDVEAAAFAGFDEARQIVPADAPEGLDTFLDLLTVTLANESDSNIETDIEVDGAELLSLATTDVDQIPVYLETECSGTPGISQLADSFSGFGDDFENGLEERLGAGTANAATTDATTTTTTTIPEIPRERVELSANPGSINYLESAVIVELVEALNHDPGDLDNPLLEESFFALVSFDVQTENFSLSLDSDSISLVDPDGRSQAGSQLFDRTGESQFRVSLDARDSARFSVSFSLEEPLVDLSGWTLWIDPGSEVPEQLPLTGPIEQVYPIELEAGQGGTVILPSLFISCQPGPFDVEVREAAVTVQVQSRNRLFRAPAETRFVTISADLVNQSEDARVFNGQPCDARFAQFEYTIGLEADGRLLSGDIQDRDLSYQEAGEARERRTLYQVPFDTQILRLLGEQGELIAEWDVSLPLVDGR